LRQTGAFLDVGTGVGWLAIEVARSWPALRVVGIDPWEAALALARENRARSGVVERIEFRKLRVEELDEPGAFTMAWLPGPFIAADIADQALKRIHDALSPGGWLIFGFNAPLPGPLEQALAQLHAARSGGHPWAASEVEERLRAHRFEKTQAFSPPVPIRYVIGRRPP
jgi:precorrin-6B methylase 2